MSTRDRRRRRGFRATAAATGMIVAGATIVAVASPAQAAACEAVEYTVVNAWNNGYQANLSITAGSESIEGWTLEFDLPSGVSVASSWNATVNQSGRTVTASDAGWNGSIPAGTSRDAFGAVLSGSADAVPTAFRLNGELCGADDPEPTPTDTDPTNPGPDPDPDPTLPPGAGEPGTNPDWGEALPPADAELSRAYEIITTGSKYDPKSGECSKDVHARYWAWGPDGKVYPTWHPTSGPGGCHFGHEHGDDPRDAGTVFDDAGWPVFGYSSEVQLDSLPEPSQRHEDHVGHKVVARDGLDVIEGDQGSFFPPGGTVLATCDILIKIHQGTHSPDAFTNHLHELILNQDCRRNNGQEFQVRYTALIPNGRPGGFGATDCPGPFNSKFTQVGESVPADGPVDNTSLGRLITGPDCAQAIRDGVLRYDPISGGQVPLDSQQLHEFWFAHSEVDGGGVSFSIDPLFYVLNPGRYYDPSKPNNLGHQVDLCDDQQIGGLYCNQVRQMGGNIAWDDPRSPFTGSYREIRVGQFSLSTNGPTTLYTDAYGQNASTTPFEGSIEQFFSGDSGSGVFIRGASQDWWESGVRLPN